MGSSVATTPASFMAWMPRGGDVEQVIGRPGAHLRGDQRAAALREFVGVDARLQAVPLAGLQNLLGLVRRVDAGLAEDVAPLGEAVARRGRDHLADELVDVEPAVRAVLDRDLVGAHERRAPGRSDAPRSSRRMTRSIFSSASGCRPYPLLASARRRAAAQHLVEPRARGRGQVVLGGLARGAHGGEDAAALGGDLGVGGAGEAAAELLAPIAAEHDVRVRIDEARHDRAARGVDDASRRTRRA